MLPYVTKVYACFYCEFCVYYKLVCHSDKPHVSLSALGGGVHIMNCMLNFFYSMMTTYLWKIEEQCPGSHEFLELK